jgi:hypothetical protein
MTMFHKISEAFMAILASVPALFTEPGSPNFMLVRAMFGLIVIVLIVYLIAMRPFRSAIASCVQKASHFFGRKS